MKIFGYLLGQGIQHKQHKNYKCTFLYTLFTIDSAVRNRANAQLTFDCFVTLNKARVCTWTGIGYAKYRKIHSQIRTRHRCYQLSENVMHIATCTAVQGASFPLTRVQNPHAIPFVLFFSPSALFHTNLSPTPFIHSLFFHFMQPTQLPSFRLVCAP